MTVFVSGLGAYLPAREVSNQTLGAITGLEPDWIAKRTGITSRRLAKAGAGTVHMGAVAAREALAHAKLAPQGVRLLLVSSSFHPRLPAESAASRLRQKLGLMRAEVVDICTPFTGFLSGLGLAAARVEATGEPALVVAAEGFSDATRLKDRRTCYQFSDGAAALLLSAEPGFARLGRVVSGELQSEDDASAGEPALRALENAAGMWRGLREAAAALGEPSGGATLHAPVQLPPLPAQEEELPGVTIHRPLGSIGDLLSAGAPLSMHQMARDNSFAAGDRLLLFASDGVTNWCACRLDDLQPVQRKWDQLSAEETLELSRGRARGPDGLLRAELRSCAEPDLREIIAAEAVRAESQGINLACVRFELRIGGEDPALTGRLEQEATALLLRQVRATDTLYQLEGTLHFVLMLRYIDQSNAERLATRLGGMLDELDLAGELEIGLARQVCALADGEDGGGFAQRVLGPAAAG